MPPWADILFCASSRKLFKVSTETSAHFLHNSMFRFFLQCLGSFVVLFWHWNAFLHIVFLRTFPFLWILFQQDSERASQQTARRQKFFVDESSATNRVFWNKIKTRCSSWVMSAQSSGNSTLFGLSELQDFHKSACIWKLFQKTA